MLATATPKAMSTHATPVPHWQYGRQASYRTVAEPLRIINFYLKAVKVSPKAPNLTSESGKLSL